jgi:hypothetical protein
MRKESKKQHMSVAVESKKENWFLKSEPLLSTIHNSNTQDRKHQVDNFGLKTNIDQIFNSSKTKGLQSVSPKSSHYKSMASPQYSPGSNNRNQSTRSRSHLQESKIDMLYDLETYTGPRVAVTKDLIINEYCINHPDKKSKFYITNNIFAKDVGNNSLNRGFCSKCSVQMAMKGFSVEEVLKEEEFCRKDRIERFLLLLSNVQKADFIKLNKAQNSQAMMVSHYRTQIDVVEQVFDSISEAILKKKQAMIHRIGLFKETSLAQVDSLCSNLKIKIDTVSAMKNDIESNLDKIITKIDTHPFNQIITNYEKNLTNLEDQINDRSHFSRVSVIAGPTNDIEGSLKILLDEALTLDKSQQTVFQQSQHLVSKAEDRGVLGRIAETDSVSEDEYLTHSSRSAGQANSLHGISRTTNAKEEHAGQRNHAFSYQFYKRPSAEIMRSDHISNSVHESKLEQSKRLRQKELSALSFDHRVVVARHKPAEEVETYVYG